MSITSCLVDHQTLDVSIEVRAHILHKDKHSYLEVFLVQKTPDCYITKADLSVQVNRILQDCRENSLSFCV